MSVIDSGVDAGVRRPSRRELRRQEARAREAASTIPLRLYGLRKGTEAVVTALCVLFSLFTLAPIAWIVINSTKSQANILESFGFWFARPFKFFHDFALLFQDVDGLGTYVRWLANSAVYAVVGGAGATALCALAGYGFARFRFRGSRALFYLVLGSLLVPLTAVTLPLFLVYAKIGLVNSVWGMLLPSMVSPVGVYLMYTYVRVSIPRELLDAARVDGGGELYVFIRLTLPLMVPGLVTVLLISVVGIWNNYFLPLIIFSKDNLYPITVGLGNWSQNAVVNGGQPLFPLLLVGSLVSIVPLLLLFIVIQRYWRGGLLFGSTTG